LGSYPAGAVGAKPAANPLHAEAALDGLVGHSVKGCFHLAFGHQKVEKNFVSRNTDRHLNLLLFINVYKNSKV